MSSWGSGHLGERGAGETKPQKTESPLHLLQSKKATGPFHTRTQQRQGPLEVS